MDIDLSRLIAFVQDGVVPRWFEEHIEGNKANIKEHLAKQEEYSWDGTDGNETITVKIQSPKARKPRGRQGEQP